MPKPRTRFQRMKLAGDLAVAIRALVADHDNLADLADGIVDVLGAPAETVSARHPFLQQLLVESGTRCCFDGQGYKLELTTGDVVRCKEHGLFKTDEDAWYASLPNREFHRVVRELQPGRRKRGVVANG